MKDDEKACPDCGGFGFIPHDCGEDTCCCADDSDDECPRCDGTGELVEDVTP
jgi:DnaJ-class molecular chaperone